MATAVAAILVPPLAALAVVGTLERSDASREADAHRAGLQELLGPSTALSSSLAVEGAWQAVRVAGLDDAISDVPGPETIRRTDEALAARRAHVSGEAGALAAATDAVTGLDDLRAEADAALAAAPDGDLARATAIEAGYTGILEAYVEGVGRSIDGLEDPELRLGAWLAWLADEQAAAVEQVGRDLLLFGIAPESPGVNTPDEVAELAAALAHLQRVDAELSSAPDPYAAVIADADPTAAIADILAQGEAAIVTGEFDISALLDDPRSAGADLRALSEAIVAHHDDLADAAADEQDDRAVRGLAMAAVGVLGVVVAVGVIVALVVHTGRGPRDDPPAGTLPPSPPGPPVPAGIKR